MDEQIARFSRLETALNEIRDRTLVQVRDELTGAISKVNDYFVAIPKAPKALKTRLTQMYYPAEGQQDIFVPAKDKLSFDNYLVQVVMPQDNNYETDFIFKNGEKSNLNVPNPKTFDIQDLHKVVIWN